MTNKQPIELIDIDKKPAIDITAIREKLASSLAGKQGKQYWRSLEELAETEEFQAYLHHEFPHWATRLAEPFSRRNFMKFMGASLAMFGLSGCQSYSEPLHPQPLEKIAPYNQQPEIMVPGKPLFFATATLFGGYATGVLVESHMGRPTKVEGNPDHPASLGATDVFSQLDILSLYDPERLQTVKLTNRISSWQGFVASMQPELDALKGTNGAGLRILTETVTSPTLGSMMESLLEAMPEAKWHQYEPANRDNVIEGAKLAFGEPVGIQYHFDKAKVILSIDSDVLSYGPGNVRYARDFASHRQVTDEDFHEMSRLYAVESMPTNTGSVADHRLPLSPSHIDLFARTVASQLGISVDVSIELADYAAWISALVADLQEHAGESLVVVGEHQPPAVHALAHAMNDALGNVGNTVTYSDPIEVDPVNQTASLKELVDDMAAEEVKLLIMIGGNPVFDAPADFNFLENLQNVPLRVHQTFYENETSVQCHWQVPLTHTLESWADARAYDGTVTIMQPLIAPLYDGVVTPYAMLSFLQGTPKTSYDLLQEYWQTEIGEADFEKIWQKTIHDGVMADSAFPTKTVALQSLSLPAPLSASEGLELNFRPDPTIWDGRYANNGWLQELPKPFTRLTWDNALLVSPALAEERGLSDGDLVGLHVDDHSAVLPVWILPGQAKDTITVHYGYGRTVVGQVGLGTGTNVYHLRTSDSPWVRLKADIRPLGQRTQLASTHIHHNMEGRDIVRSMSLDEFHHHDEHHDEHHGPQSLMPPIAYDGYAWGMSVDLTNCIGCNACVAACNVENNIAVVGKEEVLVGREMHWLRVDRYFAGDVDNPETLHQPVMCQHCEQAPCEVVCPVAATTHSSEGLNDMVYNRCVGTRFCANNCPYKVRRFNFYQYQDDVTPVIELRHNPDVTVRPRGVIEKCSYCVQRISDARIEAKKANRSIQDGEVMTACQQVCPTQAIVFGDKNDEHSTVSKRKHESRTYGLLAELNTNTRTTYMTRINNPNPAIEEHGEA